VAALWHVKN